MTPRYRVIPYKAGSASAAALADGLGGLRLRTENSRFRPRQGDVIVNWGSQREAHLKDTPARLLNDPELIVWVSDKLRFFKLMKENVPELIPPFWTEKSGIWGGDYPVVCRTILNGHSGQGIVIANNESELVDAPLYVKYMKKKHEYRVHVGKVEGRKNPDTIIAVQRKARNKSVPDELVNWHVRNHANGFIFARNESTAPVAVLDAARQAFEFTGLDFGAVDVIYNERDNKAYVLEINTAPGLAGSTVDDYVRYFHKRERETS